MNITKAINVLLHLIARSHAWGRLNFSILSMADARVTLAHRAIIALHQHWVVQIAVGERTMSDIERLRIFTQQAMAVDIEIAVKATGREIKEVQGQAAMEAAWVYVDAAIQSERERANVLVEALSKIFILGPLKEALAANEALAKYGADHG